MWEQTAIRVGAATGDGNQGAYMTQDPASERTTKLAQPTTLRGIVEEILSCLFAATTPPQTRMDMRATARLIQQWLGSKRCEQIKSARHTAHGLTHQANVICCSQAIGMV